MMRKENIKQIPFILFGVFTLFLAGCASTPRTPKISKKNFPAGYVNLVEKKQEIQINTQTLSAMAEVQAQYGRKKENFEAAILIQAPDKMRILILDELGQINFDFIADGNYVRWWDQKNDEVESVTQNEQSLKKSLRLPLELGEFISRLLLENSEENFSNKTKPNYVVYYSKENLPNNPEYPQKILFQFFRPKMNLLLNFINAETKIAISPEKFQSIRVGKESY